MPRIFSDEDRRRFRLFNGRQIDPTAAARRGLGNYFRPGHDRILMPDDFMPCGEHAGKHLRAVPPDYLLWVDAQPWSAHWDAWLPVKDYLTRFNQERRTTNQEPLFYVDPLQKWPTKIRCFKDGSSHLHTLPGWEDYLHAFVVGALKLSRDYYQPGQLPHYDLTVGKHHHALKWNCVQQIDKHQLITHRDQWLQFYRSKPQMSPDPSTHTPLRNKLR